MSDTIDEYGEIQSPPTVLDSNTMVALARSEIDMQIATARAYPRKVKLVADKIMTLATLDEETAEECCYALVFGKKQAGRDGGQQEENKPVEGASIRLAEIAAQCWGNNRVYARVVMTNRTEKYVEAEGVFHDLETNTMSLARVQRRIAGQRGNLYPEHLIITTANAACAIAKRNAILAGIPRGIYRPAYREARKIIAGTVVTLAANRDKMMSAFASYGVKPEQILSLLGLDSVMDLRVDHIATLRALYSSIKNEENKVEDIFAPQREEKRDPADNPLNDDPVDIGKPTSDAKATEKPVEGDKAAAATSTPAKTKTAAPAPETATAAATEKVYPLDQFVKDCAAAQTYDDLEDARNRNDELLRNITGSNKARALAAIDAAEERIEAANKAWEESNGKADQGEEQEAGEVSVSAVAAGINVVGRADDGPSPVDTGRADNASVQGISSGEAREAPENAGNNASVGSAGGSSIPAGNWNDKEAKWLTNVATKFAAATDAKSALAAEQFWQPQIHLKSDAVRAAFREMATAAKARFMGGRG